jgi:hypothetical protein
MFGDEELEERYGVGDIVLANQINAGTGEEPRLSRELEVGFRDDSDDDGPDGNTSATHINN